MTKFCFEKYCKNYQDIENFEKALKDNFKGWHCHHRLETHNSDGERRLVDISAAELLALGMYYNRPAEELIFLTISEHSKLHSEGEHNPMYGKQGYWKGKTGPNKGKRLSKEHINKVAEANRGKHWYNNGKETKFCFDCLPGFVPGRLRK